MNYIPRVKHNGVGRLIRDELTKRWQLYLLLLLPISFLVVFNYVPLPGAEEAIYSRISDISVSMKALDYLDMPDQVAVRHYVEMDAPERAAYDKKQARKRAILKALREQGK